jgi:hypothetical protein
MSTNHPLVKRLSTVEKMEMIKSGKRRRSLTGIKEHKNITIQNKGGKYVVVEKVKKFEESGVTKKKRNYIEFESKLGVEKETDLTKIAGPKKDAEIQPRKEERIFQKKKKLEYLDNYQYKETKQFGKKPKISVVIHKRLGDIIGGTVEITTFERYSANTRPLKSTPNQPRSTRTFTQPKKGVNIVKNQTKTPNETKATATKTMTTTTKVGRRGGAGGPTSTTTKTTTQKTTTRTTRRGMK